MSNLDDHKGLRRRPVSQKLTAFGHQHSSKDFHLRSSCDRPRYVYDSIVKPILKIKILISKDFHDSINSINNMMANFANL